MTENQHTYLDIEIAHKAWFLVEGLNERLAQAAIKTLSMLPKELFPLAQKAQMTLLLTSDQAVQELNREFRDKDKPTNILSFPQFDPDALYDLAEKDLSQEPLLYIGDLAAAYETTIREAKEQKKEPLDHITHLTIHGILHVFGFDHIKEEDAEDMEALEQEIMAALGLFDPYADYEG